jgi:hypothetical protein
MLFYLLLKEDSVATYEQRIGYFVVPCPLCGQEGWQILFRLYKTRGSTMDPPSPTKMPSLEAFQVRCSICAGASVAFHPAYWASTLGVPLYPEAYPPTPAHPGYAYMAFGPGP